MIARAILRHMLPVGLSAALVLAIWVVGTLPMTAIFLIDDAFVAAEYVEFLAYASGISLALSSVVLFPLAVLGEALAKRNGRFLWGYPGFLCLGTGVLLAIRIVTLRSLLDAILSWSGLAALVSVVFLVYWAVLWAKKAAWAGWQRLRERAICSETQGPLLG